MPDRLIWRTDHVARHPWPEEVFLQGGDDGLVLTPVEGVPSYRTAFVEAFTTSPATLIRGEGETVAAAEDAAWAGYTRMTSCPAHPVHGPFVPRGYRNGAGFCRACDTWFPEVLPPGLECLDQLLVAGALAGGRFNHAPGRAVDIPPARPVASWLRAQVRKWRPS